MSEPKRITTIAIMARVSTAKQETLNQLAQLREFASKQGWTIYAEYVDVVTGSGKKQRKEFDRMMEAARQKKFDLVLFWALDRLSREGTLETLQHLQRLTSFGVDWRSYTEQYIDSCGMFRDVVISLLATMARQERLQIGERTRAGLERARKAGKILGRPRLELDQADLAARLARGESSRTIARGLGVSQALIIKTLKKLKPAQPPWEHPNVELDSRNV